MISRLSSCCGKLSSCCCKKESQEPHELMPLVNENEDSFKGFVVKNCRMDRRASETIFHSKVVARNSLVLDTASTVATTPVASPTLLSTNSEVKSPTHVELTVIQSLHNNDLKASQTEAREFQDVSLPHSLKKEQRSIQQKLLIGLRIASMGGLLWSIYEMGNVLADSDDTALITRYGLAIGACFGSLLGSTDRGIRFLRRLEAEAALIITLQGLVANSFGWRSATGDLILSLTSPLFVSTVFAGNMAAAAHRRTFPKSHTRTASRTIVGLENAPQPDTFKQLIQANKFSLASSAALITAGAYGWSQAGNSFAFNTLSQGAIHLGTVISSKLIAHHFLDSYFLRYKNLLGMTASTISSIFVSEQLSDNVGPVGTIFFMMGLGLVLAAEQKIKTNQVNKRIKLMEVLEHHLRKDPEFIDALKLIAQQLHLELKRNASPKVSLCGLINLSKCGVTRTVANELMLYGINLAKCGFTPTTLKTFAGLSLLIAISPLLSGTPGVVQFSTAYASLVFYYHISNYVRLNKDKSEQFHQDLSRKILEKIFVDPFKYIARISLFPQTLLWGYYVNYVWTRAYQAIGETSNVPGSISYGVTPGDFALFFGTAGGLYSRRYTPTEWERISERTAKTLISFFENSNDDYTFPITAEEINAMLEMAKVPEAKPDPANNDIHRIDVAPSSATPSNLSVDIGYHGNKLVCDVIQTGFFSKRLRMIPIEKHDLDTSESKKLLYTAMWPDVWRLVR